MKPLDSYKLKSKWRRLETRWRRGFLSLGARVTHSRAATPGAFSRKRSRSFPVFAIMRTCRPFPAPLTVTRNTLLNMAKTSRADGGRNHSFAMEYMTQSLKEIPCHAFHCHHHVKAVKVSMSHKHSVFAQFNYTNNHNSSKIFTQITQMAKTLQLEIKLRLG